MKAILLFDIDGTLLKVQSRFLKELIAEQLHSLGIDYSAVKNNRFAGRTDNGIFMELIGRRPDAEQLFPLLKNKYIDEISRNLTAESLTIFEKAIEAVHTARSAGYRVGLCTGNFREVAHIKVNAAGLEGVFEFGGFGCAHQDRNFLPGLAHEEYCSLFNETPLPEQYIVIGDTPNDIKCAKHFGAKAVAVTTGLFSGDELKKHNPDLLLQNLSNAESWLQNLTD